VYNDEKPRTVWAEILFLAERLGSGPSLIPSDPGERTRMMGLAHEICGESGLGWTRRLALLRPAIEAGPAHPGYEFSRLFGDMYGYSKAAGDAADGRCVDILTVLSSQLAAQLAAGKRYLVGDALSAADLYWAAFAALIDPLPDDKCRTPMPPAFRTLYSSSPPEVRAAASKELMALRDTIYEEVVGLPLDF
jgi:glutathione S-transferase